MLTQQDVNKKPQSTPARQLDPISIQLKLTFNFKMTSLYFMMNLPPILMSYYNICIMSCEVGLMGKARKSVTFLHYYNIALFS